MDMKRPRARLAPCLTGVPGRIHACHTEYTPATHNTRLHHGMHTCHTDYTPATQNTRLPHRIHACHTEYTPATQNTRLPHRTHTCRTEYTPATQKTRLPHRMHTRLPHRMHTCHTEYMFWSRQGLCFRNVGVALGPRGVATRMRKNPTRHNTQHNNILASITGGPNFSF